MTREASKPTSVRIGQLWRDNDKRSTHRVCRIVDISVTHATVLWASGNKTRIRLDRFRPNSTGYVLLQDVTE